MKVGDYVRTKYGIKQIYEIDNNKTVWKYKFKLKKQDGDGCVDLGCFSDSEVIKSSPNIIDLIEENDLIKYRINGDLYVSEVEGVPIFDKYKLSISYADTIIFLEELDIVSVVTREQFESMEYRIGE